MNKIADIILDERTKDLPITQERMTARAIILDGFNILMAYSRKFDDYMTPGGGIDDEDFEVALDRELREEMGLSIKEIKPIGYIEELRLNENGSVLYQKSHYFFASIDQRVPKQLEDYEQAFGLEPAWVNIKEVIQHNDKIIENRIINGIRGVHPFSTLRRENEVLKYILREYLHEKI